MEQIKLDTIGQFAENMILPSLDANHVVFQSSLELIADGLELLEKNQHYFNHSSVVKAFSGIYINKLVNVSHLLNDLDIGNHGDTIGIQLTTIDDTFAIFPNTAIDDELVNQAHD